MISRNDSQSLGLWNLFNVWDSKYLENTTFRKRDVFLSTGERRKTPTAWGPLDAVIEVSSFQRTQQSRCLLPLTWLRRQIQFPKRYVCLKFRMMCKVQQSSGSVCYTPSLLPSRVCEDVMFIRYGMINGL
jgi:hypothetical protein